MFKDFLKKFLPPPTNMFNREIGALRADAVAQRVEQNKQIRELLAQISNCNELLQQLEKKTDSVQNNQDFLQTQIAEAIDSLKNIHQNNQQLLENVNANVDAAIQKILLQLESDAQLCQKRMADMEWQLKHEMWRYSRLYQQLSFYRSAVENDIDFASARNSVFKSLPKAVGAQRRLQMMECYLLSQLQRICAENGLQYWVSDGTLLGAVRHDGFVPWDDDMDVSMPREDFERLRFILSSSDTFQIVDYYCLSQRQFFSKISKFVDISSGTNVFIDVFPYDFYDVPSVQEVRAKYWKCRSELADDLENLIPKLKYRYCDCMVDDLNDKAALDEVFQRHVEKLDTQGKWMGWSIEIWDSEARAGFPTDFILPCAEHVFEELVVNVPRKPDECLQQVYGEYMLFPLDVGYQNHTAIFGLDQQDEAVSVYLKRNGVSVEEEHRRKDDTQ